MTMLGHVMGNIGAMIIIILMTAFGTREVHDYPEPHELRGTKALMMLVVLFYIWFFAWSVLFWWQIGLILLAWLIADYLLDLVWMWKRI